MRQGRLGGDAAVLGAPVECVAILRLRSQTVAALKLVFIGGELHQTQERLVEAWAELRRAELLENWSRLQAGRLPLRIAPLR